ncbi:hypothetical protein PUR26_14910 [Streptomyces sp. SP18CS02]|nr:hypothetical protein [Streptomyces sp. SP18CS02]MEE1753716.1 hypothetical protein [Streptomyces sp. SP18CS02]
MAVVCALVLAVLTVACRQTPGAGAPAAGLQDTTAATGYGEVFLGPGDCSTRGRDFREVSCGSESAWARVLSRFVERPAAGPVCPSTTDFVLHVSENRPAVDEDGDGSVPQGYACMRNLEPPHPGDPGGGGGPHTVVGDCVYSSRKGEVKETACDGSGEERPEYRVAAAVEDRSRCPAATALYVQLGGASPVGCARRV